MIVQITRTRNECFLLKEMLPLWSKYADGFVFFNDDSTDDTLEFLEQNKEKYNILSIITKRDDIIGELKIESDDRQQLFDEAYKYTNKIICMDSDEYLESDITKEQLESILDNEDDCKFYLEWVQYTSEDTIRIDSHWNQNHTDRIGKFKEGSLFPPRQMHSLHLPSTRDSKAIPRDIMYIAHLQWLDKRWVGVKQYFWKVTDYVNKLLHNADVVGAEAYDHSVNNFQWLYTPAPRKLRVRSDIFSIQDMKKNDRLIFIKKYTQMYNIPNLGDWGMGIYEYCIKDDK
jgi:regulator of extracellular matrix RemA (YlzA/DUF370 family)